MTITITITGLIRLALLPFRTTGRMLYSGARGVVRTCIAVIKEITGSVRTVGRGFRRIIHGTDAVIAFGISSTWKALLRFLSRARHAVATGLVHAAKLAAMPFILIYRLPRRAASFGVARFRAIFLNLSSTAMTLSMEDGHARLLVLKGSRVVAWRAGRIAQRPKEADGDSEHSDGKNKSEKSGFNPLESLFEGLPARSKRVVADLPLHVPLLRHVPLPEVKSRYLKGIVDNEVLDSVPFAADELDIRWKIETVGDSKEASVIAVPSDRMDEQARIVRDAQLAQSAVYPKASALAAAVGRPDVFILHMTPAQTAVILVRGGVPRIVHRLELPQDINEQAEVIAMGVEQVAGYHRTQRPEDAVGDLPVVVTGEVDPVKDLVGLLATHLDRTILPFNPDVEYPEGFDPAEYASNIGLFLADRTKESTRVISAQNVLPERYLPWRPPVAAMGVFAGILALGYLSFTVTGLVSNVAGELEPLTAKLEAMEKQAREYRLTVARQRVFDKGIAEADLQALELESNLLLIQEEMDTLLARIGDITGNAGPSNVELVRFEPREDGFSVSGSAGSYSDVLEYAASMRSSPNFEDAKVVQVYDSSGSQVKFTIGVTIPMPDPEEEEEPDT